MVDPDIDERVGRIYAEIFQGETRRIWNLQTVPAPPPNSGVANTLQDLKAAFKQRYGEVKGK